MSDKLTWPEIQQIMTETRDIVGGRVRIPTRKLYGLCIALEGMSEALDVACEELRRLANSREILEEEMAAVYRKCADAIPEGYHEVR